MNRSYTTEVVQRDSTSTVVKATPSDPMILSGRYTVYTDGRIVDQRGRRISKNAFTLRDALLSAVRAAK